MARAGSVRVNIDADASGMQRGVNDAERSLSRLNRTGGKVMKGMGIAALGLGAAAGTGLGLALKIGTEGLMAQEKASARTRNVIETTGGAANITADQLEKLSDSLERTTGSEADVVQGAGNLLLTFTKVRDEAGKNNDIFSRAVPLINDMSVALGTDMNAASLQVGKALNDPIKGVTALSRAGVSFTQQQRDQIKSMQDSGNILGAQKIILGELAVQFGGAASAEGEMTEGLQQMQRAAERAADELAAKVLPTVISIAQGVQRHWPTIERVSREAFTGAQRAAQRAMAWFDTNVLPTIRAIVAGARAFWDRFGDDITRVFNLARTLVGNKLKAIGAVIEGVMAVLRGDWSTAWKSLKTVVSTQLDSIKTVLKDLPATMLSLALEIGKAIADGVISGMGDLVGRVKKKIKDALGAGDNTAPIRPENITGQRPDSLPGNKSEDARGRARAPRPTRTGGSPSPLSITDRVTGLIGDRHRDDTRQDKAVRSRAVAGASGVTNTEKLDAIGERAVFKKRKEEIDADVNTVKSGIRKVNAAIVARRRLLISLRKKRRNVKGKNTDETKALQDKVTDQIRAVLDQIRSLFDERRAFNSELVELRSQARDIQYDIGEIDAELANMPDVVPESDPTSDPTSDTPASAGISPDGQAQIDQANARAATAGRSASISDSFLRTLFGSGSIDPAGGSVSVTIQTLHPGDPALQGEIARWIVGAFGGQGSVPASNFAAGT